MVDPAQPVVRRLALSCLIALAAANATRATQQIDLVLDIDYATGSSTSGGSWQLFARTDGFGLFSLRAPLTGVSGPITDGLPVGRVNGSPTDNAGFSVIDNRTLGVERQLLYSQSVVSVLGGEAGLFYGVGSQADGAPSGANAIGPALASLSDVRRTPWATGGAPWAEGVLVASGLFDPGLTPAFGTGSGVAFEGAVLTSVGTANDPGMWTFDTLTTRQTISDLVFGVATGDYNGDGRVDVADYTLWRDTLDDQVTPLTGADGDGDGVIGDGDRVIWANNYGRFEAVSAVATPEPAAGFGALLLAFTAAAAPRWRGRSGGRKTPQRPQRLLDTMVPPEHIRGWRQDSPNDSSRPIRSSPYVLFSLAVWASARSGVRCESNPGETQRLWPTRAARQEASLWTRPPRRSRRLERAEGSRGDERSAWRSTTAFLRGCWPLESTPNGSQEKTKRIVSAKRAENALISDKMLERRLESELNTTTSLGRP